MKGLALSAIVVGYLLMSASLPANSEERSSVRHSPSPDYSANMLENREYALEALIKVKVELQPDHDAHPGNPQQAEEDSYIR